MNDQDLRQSPEIQLLTGLAMLFAARTIPITAITVPNIRNDMTTTSQKIARGSAIVYNSNYPKSYQEIISSTP